MDRKELSQLTSANRPKPFYGYVVVAASFIIQAVSFGVFSSFGVFFIPLLTEFGWSRATLSGAHSLTFLIMGFLAILMGGLNDRFGPRVVVAVCGFIFGLGYLLISQVHAVWQLYLFYGVIAGTGLSSMDVIPLSTVARWFVKRRGMMTGIIKEGTGVGMLVMPLVIVWLISAYDWRSAYIIIGAFGLAVIIAAAQFLKRDPGQVMQLPEGGEEAAADGVSSMEKGVSFREAILLRQFWTICAVYLSIFFCTSTVMTHVAPHAVDLGISATEAAGILSTIGGASIAGRFVAGTASDRVGAKRAYIICCLILIAGLIWLQFASELWMFYLFAAVYGFSHGGFFSLISPIVAWLFGTRSLGAILGVVIFSGAIGAAAGPFLGGYIFDVTDSYRLAFLILIVSSITSLILTTSLRPISEGGTDDSRRNA